MSSSTITRIGSEIWDSIQTFSDFVAHLFGVTAPMYELYLEDAEAYQKEVMHS